MVTSVRTPEDVANLVLQRIGYKGPRIGNLLEGSEAAKVILDVYGQTRDELITDGEWEFAERIVPGTLLKQAPTNGYIVTPWTNAFPDLPWLFSYAYPSDALKIRSVRITPLFIPNFDPQHNIYSLGNDNGFTPPRQVILTMVPNAMITYAGRVTDPTTWNPAFNEALVAAISRRIAGKLSDPRLVAQEAQDEEHAHMVALTDKG